MRTAKAGRRQILQVGVYSINVGGLEAGSPRNFHALRFWSGFETIKILLQVNIYVVIRPELNIHSFLPIIHLFYSSYTLLLFKISYSSDYCPLFK